MRRFGSWKFDGCLVVLAVVIVGLFVLIGVQSLARRVEEEERDGGLGLRSSRFAPAVGSPRGAHPHRARGRAFTWVA
jgi:hypothetical protein